jgi:hypothetical protein
MLLLDLQATAVPSGPRAQVVARERPRRVGVVVLVGVLVLATVIGGVARFAGGDGGDPVSTPETSVPTSATTTLAPTTNPVASSASITTRPPTTPPTTASVAYVNGRMGAVFGEKVAFRLYAFDATTLRGYVDTATGQLVNAASTVPGDQVFAGSESRLFVFNSRTQTLSTIDRNLREAPTTIARNVTSAFPSTTGKLWAVVDRSDSTNVSHVLEFAADGTKSSELAIQAPFSVRGSLGGAIVTAAAGQIFLHDPKTARVSSYAVGDLMAINGNRVAWLGCDAMPSCHVYIGDATRPRLATIGLSTLPPEAYWVLSLSPTGDAAVVPPTGKPGFRLLNFATGLDLALTAGDDNLSWSPDGKWLFNTNSTPPQAIDVPGGRAVDILLSGPDRSPFRVVPL